MKKKIISMLLCVALILPMATNSKTIGAEEETIDYSDYEEIKTPEDMDKLSYIVNGKYYLSADIDMSKYNGTYKPVTGFYGVLDGRGHTIKNLRTAVINTIVGNATVRNVKIEGAYRGENYAGLLLNEISLPSSAGEAEVLIEEVSTEGKMANYAGYAGGICYAADTNAAGQKIEIRNCQAQLEAGGNYGVAGIVSRVVAEQDSTILIKNCASSGIMGRRDGTGGLSMATGGIVGYSKGAEIQNCYSNVSELAGNFCGGIVGTAYRTTIQNCISDSYVAGYYSGGLVGCVPSDSQVTINSSVSLAEKIYGPHSIGAVVGSKAGSVTMDKVFTYKKLYNEGEHLYLEDPDATALTAMQLTEESAYAGLDFESTFACVPGVNRDRILLKELGECFVTDAPIIEVQDVSEDSKIVSMRSASPDAWIFYTNGAGPATKASNVYRNPITVDKNTYFNAIAVVDGYGVSVPQEAKVEFKVQTPAANVASGSYKTDLSVSLTCNSGGATIYYTLDGSSPTTKSFCYTGTPISLSKNGTYIIHAIAVKNGWTSSEELSVKYTIQKPAATSNTSSNGSSSSGSNSTSSMGSTSKNVSGNTSDNSSVKIYRISRPGKVKGLKLTKKNTKKLSGKSRYSLTWKKVKGVSGYEVQQYVNYVYRRVSGTQKTTKTVKKNAFKNKKIYWTDYISFSGQFETDFVSKVRVRAYKTVNGKKIYGSYSSWKTILTNKQVKKELKKQVG